MEKIIRRFAEEHGLVAGICDCTPLVPEGQIHNRKIPFVRVGIEDRLNPKAVMPDGKSIIMLAMGYAKKIRFDGDHKIRGNISVGAVGTDYHQLLRAYLECLRDKLRQYGASPFQCEIFVDTGPLMEREIAKKAGVGWQGKNCSIITQELGSFVYLGYMITDLLLSPSKPYNNGDFHCGGCNRCVVSCPGGALGDDFSCNAHRCISYLTQKKGILTDLEMSLMGNALYGCDICQIVCPCNQNKQIDEIWKIEAKCPDLEKFLFANDEEFHRRYGETAAYWRGRPTLSRNALVALGNSGDSRALSIVAPFLESKDNVLRYTALWAAKKLNQIKYG